MVEAINKILSKDNLHLLYSEDHSLAEDIKNLYKDTQNKGKTKNKKHRTLDEGVL